MNQLRAFVLSVVFTFCGMLSSYSQSHYSEWMVSSEMKRTPHPYNLNFSSWWPQWSYQVGVELDPMLDVYLKYEDPQLLAYLKEYPQKMIDANGNITGYSYSDFNLDNVRPGHFILRMYEQEPSKKDSIAIATLMKQLDNQPRTNNGVWWHKEIYHWQVWLDGVFMGMPFYTRAAGRFYPDEVNDFYDDAVDQMTTTDEKTFDEATGLWKHAWDETHTMFWADPSTGQSQHTWGRALGWYAMALSEVLDVMPESYARRGEVLDIFQRVMAAVADYQDEATGVWYDVMDVDDPRNYLEATCSSMFAYCLLKGVRMGWLEPSLRQNGIKAYRGIINEFVKKNSNGTISLTKCCEVSGLGPENKPQRDGSFEYYMSENVRDNDPKGVGPFIWASLEMEELGYNIDNLNEELTEIRSVECGDSDMDAIYSITGVRMGKQTDANRLPAGIYVKSGRKFVVH